jgi:tetratricopeptide (TPR) repeat protein
VLRNTCVRPLAALTAMLCLGLWLPAFSQGLGHTVRGELKSSTPRTFSEYMVQLHDPTHRSSFSRVEVRNDGIFEIRNVPPGEYTVEVTTLHGDVLLEQPVSINPQTPLEVRFPDQPVKHQGAHTISLKQLLHPPTRKAVHSFAAAQRFSESGDYAKAATALERAVEESPDYAEAHVNLGVQYIRMGRYEAAAEELGRAIQIAGPTSITLCNLAWVQMRLGRRDQAIESVRAGLRLDQASPQGHLILGNLLAMDPRTREEAITHLEKAKDTLPSAAQALANLRAR